MASAFDQRWQRVGRQLNVVHIYHTAHRPQSDPAKIEEARALLASLPVTYVPDVGELPPCSHMPLQHNDFFVGRTEDLLRIAESVKSGGSVGVGELIAATGLGGLGKTQLAVEFVHRYGRYFAGGVYWLSFGIPEEVPTVVAGCGSSMDLRPDFSELELQEQLRLILGAWQSSIPRLLVFDNCEEEALLAQWRPPRGGCSVLLTARRATWDPILGVRPIALDVLPRADSINLLRQYCPDLVSSNPALASIAAELGDLPLALHLAGSFLHRYGGEMSPSEYVGQLRESRVLDNSSLLGRRLTPQISPTRHVQNVAQTFALSYEMLTPTEEVDQTATSLLARAACFAPAEPIPFELLFQALPEAATLDQRLLRVDAQARLVDLGLLQRSEDSVRMHRLVARFVSASIDDRAAAGAVEAALSNWGQSVGSENDRVRVLRALPHLRYVTNAAISRAKDLRAAELCTTLAKSLRTLGDYSGAKPYLWDALVIRQETLGPDHLDTAASLNRLAALLQDQGELATARPLLERALAIRERVLGADHPDTASSLHNLGWLLRAQGELAAARYLYERALAVRERILGPDHPDTATSLQNLGWLLRDQGELAAARPFSERALAIRERVLGPDHPDTARSLTNLAWLLRDQGELSAARHLYQRALAIRERVLGPDHPDTAHSLHRLAWLLRAQGELDTARSLSQRALAIRERVLGPDHPDTAASLAGLASLLQDQGELVAARPLHEHALAIRERVLGPDHPDTAASLYHLAWLLREQGDLASARPLSERAVVIWERLLGPNHPDVAHGLHRLSWLLREQGELTSARPLSERALAIREQVLGPDHPDTAASLHNLACLHQEQEDLVAARSLSERALAIRERVLGPDHPDTAASLHHLASLLREQGEFATARRLSERALAIRERVLGHAHPDTTASARNLASLLEEQW